MRILVFAAILLCVAALGIEARAELPSGAYAIDVTGEDGLVLPSGASEICESAPEGEVCVTSDLATDSSGAVTGSAIMTIDGGGISADITLALDGKVSGTTQKPKTNLKFTAEGTATDGILTLDLEGSGKMNCKLDATTPGQLACKVKMRLCAFSGSEKLSCQRLPFQTAVEFERTPFTVQLDVATDEKNRVSGEAEVVVAAEPAIPYTAKGRYNERKDTTNLKLQSVDKAAKTRVALKKAVLELGSASAGTMTFKVAGQKGKVVLPTLTPTFAGRGTCLPGSFCDVNQDTAALFRIGSTTPSMSLEGTIYYGILGAGR